jgi:hypothetical protein
MSSNIRIAQNINSVLVVDNALLPNSYDISFTLSMHTSKPYEQNVVIERLRFLCESVISNSIMIAYDNTAREILSSTLENGLIVLESAPYDAPVCKILYLKASSILEEQATIESMSLCSQLGQNIDYFADSDDDYIDLATCSWLPKGQTPWWLRADITTNDQEKDDIETWNDLGLGWKEIKSDAETTIIEFPKFQPKVVQGELNAS